MMRNAEQSQKIYRYLALDRCHENVMTTIDEDLDDILETMDMSRVPSDKNVSHQILPRTSCASPTTPYRTRLKTFVYQPILAIRPPNRLFNSFVCKSRSGSPS